ncbi:hypothetical protein BDA99DRAFT_573239 [Phascolomyces articulosus]|uniref:Uncharacterized protein n=1 Tax=Phascolomyces articulosus TaxID=60185 RepID=A0AAD5KAT4_9FUNG|nr:hypothetical protein BDA99DRAFT_573239 [Phascolomyces articulosus]
MRLFTVYYMLRIMLIMGLQEQLCTSGMEPMESCINYQAQQKRRIADQKSSVETVHLVLGVNNAICYYVLLFHASGRGLLDIETFLDLWTLYCDKLTAMSIDQTGFISASSFFLVDLVICWIMVVEVV